MGKYAPESKRVGPALLTILLATAGCIGPLELEEVLLWQGALEPVAGASTSVSGTMAMAANAQFTQVGIGIDAAEPGLVVGWLVRQGSCASPGARVGPPAAFPPFEIGESGEGDREATLNYRLERSGYAGQVTAEPDGGGEVLACADLQEES
jgi:hypothetical protein